MSSVYSEYIRALQTDRRKRDLNSEKKIFKKSRSGIVTPNKAIQ